MAEGTVELVVAGLTSWREGDEGLMRRVFHPDAVFIDHTRPDALELRGHEGFLRAYRSWAGAWEDADLDWADPELLAPGLALVEARLSGTARASRLRLERTACVLYWAAGGRLLRLEVFPGEREAREAAGRLV